MRRRDSQAARRKKGCVDRVGNGDFTYRYTSPNTSISTLITLSPWSALGWSAQRKALRCGHRQGVLVGCQRASAGCRTGASNGVGEHCAEARGCVPKMPSWESSSHLCFGRPVAPHFPLLVIMALSMSKDYESATHCRVEQEQGQEHRVWTCPSPASFASSSSARSASFYHPGICTFSRHRSIPVGSCFFPCPV